MFNLTHFPVLTVILILGYPAVAIVVLEFARRVAARVPFVSTILRRVIAEQEAQNSLRAPRFSSGQPSRGTLTRSGRGYRPPSYFVPEHTQIRRDPF